MPREDASDLPLEERVRQFQETHDGVRVVLYESSGGETDPTFEPVAVIEDGEVVDADAGWRKILASYDLGDVPGLLRKFDGPRRVANLEADDAEDGL